MRFAAAEGAVEICTLRTAWLPRSREEDEEEEEKKETEPDDRPGLVRKKQQR